jgi:hypothetical protein
MESFLHWQKIKNYSEPEDRPKPYAIGAPAAR